MGRMLLATSLVLGFAAAVSAQPAPRFELGPVVRADAVFIEGDARGGSAVGGVAASVRISKRYGLEGELTRAWNRIDKQYEGWFVSYAEGPNATREEIERLAPILRKSSGYAPQFGGAAAFVIRLEQSQRVNMVLRAGVSGRRYVETTAFEVVSIPDGVDRVRFASDFARDFRGASRRTVRGGLLLGVGWSLAVTDNLSVSPELRFVYGGPARIGNNYRELGLGARGAWRF